MARHKPKGEVSRYGVGRYGEEGIKRLFSGHVCQGCAGHVHRNALPHTEGIAIFPISKQPRWKGKVRGVVEGGEDSLAHHMTDFIEKQNANYPYRNEYAFLGPNSNTYVGRVLAQFPGSGLTLPWNAFGKGYRS